MTRRKRNNEDVVSHLEICDEAIVKDEAVDLLTNDSVIQYLKHSVKTVFKCPHVTFNIFYLTLQFFLIFCTVFTLIYPVIVVDLKSQEIYFYLFKDSLNSSVAGAR